MKAWSLFFLAALFGSLSVSNAQIIPGTNQTHVHSGKLPVRQSDTVRNVQELRVPDVTDVAETTVEPVNVSAYPNPTVDVLTLTSQESSITSVDIFDVQGNVVLTLQPRETSVSVDVANFRAGTYVARLVLDGQVQSVKFVVTR